MPSRSLCLNNAPIAEHLEEIRALCRQFGVARLEVFASVCTPEFDPARSDIDFLVEYPDDYDFGPWRTRFQPLEDTRSDLLSSKVDLVMSGALRNTWFRRGASKTRTGICDASQIAAVA